MYIRLYAGQVAFLVCVSLGLQFASSQHLTRQHRVMGTFFTVQTVHMRFVFSILSSPLSWELMGRASYWYLVTNYFMPLRLFTGIW